LEETTTTSTSVQNNKRIAKNTVFLYLRMFITMGVSLFTSRVVLNTLGVEDFGIYNVVGGMVMMFSTVNTSMATAVQRFMNFEMGKNNHSRLNNIFNTSVLIHFVIAIILFVLIELIGVWYLNNHMNIPEDRLDVANFVLQFSIFTLIVSVISVPYNAAIIANERMSAFAIISIIEVTLQLVIVYLLVIFNADKLKVYSVLMFVVAVIIRIVYGIYSKRNFKECSFKWHWDTSLFKEMSSFAGWNLIGVSSTMLRTQGISLLLNFFFDVIINAATGIAFRVKNAFDSFAGNFMTAISPQITKSYAAKDFNYLMQLIFRGSKFSYYLLLFIFVPIFIETETVLKLWLKIVPDYSVIFVRLLLIVSLIEVLSKTLIQAMFATGDIKKYQIVVGSVTLLNIPISFLFLYLDFYPEIVFVVAIIIAFITLFVRLFMLKKMINILIRNFIFEVLFIVLIVTVLSMILPFLFTKLYNPNNMRLLINLIISLLSVSTMVYIFGLNSKEKAYVKKAIFKTVKIGNK
jgi:O-antigen/teichoic acid export membrane protein